MEEHKVRSIAREEAKKFFENARFVRESEMEQIVDKTIKKTLQGLGVDIDNPIEVQRSFVDLRSWSDLKKAISQSIVSTLFKSITIGVVALLVIGFWAWINGVEPPS